MSLRSFTSLGSSRSHRLDLDSSSRCFSTSLNVNLDVQSSMDKNFSTDLVSRFSFFLYSFNGMDTMLDAIKFF
ncbi:hypothetical protein BpHYR1_054559 [Brachionus plicatilis]|uniref:Uncharacterized protein n=1 Tax=Brachionus plicatilis TaxID=10195 RepID=A0A3M7SEQ4_BRAPC|nr:hypothetical protein BpHYR1_054559 [Brachionus plicatilis]